MNVFKHLPAVLGVEEDLELFERVVATIRIPPPPPETW